MSRTRPLLYVDAAAGASGDMILGALFDLGVPVKAVRAALDSLSVDGWTLTTRRIRRAGIAARKANVRVARRPARRRGWKEISRIVRGGSLDPRVRDRALEIFRSLIEAEAIVHGVSPEEVHLHELGATDAIVDIVGACVGFAHLAPRRIVVSPLTTGYGTVRCEHGVYPVPAPATVLLTRGVPVRAGEIEAERLTPTGAAILTGVADAWGPPPPMRPRAVGHGAGDRDLGDTPNLLRMILGDPGGPGLVDDAGERVLVIEFDVDDAPPQVLAFASERLYEAGALEVHTTPVHMKKGRTGHHVTVLGRPGDLERLAEVALRETTTLGIRHRLESRIELPREIVEVRTAYGRVRIKVGRIGDRAAHAWPEYEDCAAIARRRDLPLQEIQQAALGAYRSSEAGGKARRRKRSRTSS